MQTEEELNKEILEITMNIVNNHPEISKYLDEMPVTIPNKENPEITIKNLKAYKHSLITLISNYEQKKNSIKPKGDNKFN